MCPLLVRQRRHHILKPQLTPIMKKLLVLGLISFVPGCAVAVVAELAVRASVNVLNVPILFGILFAVGLLFLALSDYSGKPRFRAGGMRTPSARAATPAVSRHVDAASAWTYTTISA